MSETHAHTNALIRETSPYLLQHAHNPVDWQGWNVAAFQRARQEQRPIFLSVGYSTCYWCHVMERQSFENEQIAALMNELFVCIKVDREERPDVDDIYMTAVQLMTRQGGWPMSVFLTPPGAASGSDRGLKPFYGGTYYPPEPMHGRPSFPQVLRGVAEAWRDRREEVLQQADRLAEAVRQGLEQREPAGPVSIQAVKDAVNRLLRNYDAEHGGFGHAPKFPQPANLQLLLAAFEGNSNADLWDAIRHTLDRMARGGMYDQVGGGFHRYSVDEKWLVPHFEKMLYDNGQLLELYAAAAEASHDEDEREQWQRVLRETGDYLLREMCDESGAFWSAQDAEVDAREGANYVWTAAEVREAIADGELAAFALQLYGIDRGPNFQDPHHADAKPVNVLFLPQPLHRLAPGAGTRRDNINRQLKQVRDQRRQPATDDKVLVAWNGMAIAGLAAAGRVLGEQRFIDSAGRAADAVYQRMRDDDGGLLRTMRRGEAKIPAFLDDYAFLMHGLLALHRARPEEQRWLERAADLADEAIARFGMHRGGYYDTLADQADLFVRKRSLYDGAIPSPSSQMAHNLLDLARATGDKCWLDRFVLDVRSVAEELRTQGAGVPHLCHAVLRALSVEGLVAERLAEPAATEQRPGGAVQVELDPAAVVLAGGRATFAIRLVIAPGYHVAAPGADGSAFSGLDVTLTDAPGATLDLDYPPGTSRLFTFAQEAMPVYEGTVVLRATLRAESSLELRPAKLVLRYQACDEASCQPPQRVELPLPIQ